MAVFFYDLLRTTRRGRVVLLRIAYALVLLIALYKLHSDRFAYMSFTVIGPVNWNSETDYSKRLAKFAEEFAGATFSPSGDTLFVNIQASLGVTFAIWGPWGRLGI